MDITNAQRAKVLVHALPYIQEYTGKVVVIKYGGNAMINEKLKDSVMRDIVLLSLIGVKVVLVHGGDKDLVNLIENKGGSALGLSGVDGHMISAKTKHEKLGFVGEIESVNVKPINDVIDKGYIPVVSTVGCDENGNVYNINADTAAAKIAGELGAESLISMTDIAGILKDKDDVSTLIPVIKVSEIPNLIESGIISGGMIPKVECCIEAINLGVKHVFIIDGTISHAILVEMLTNEGIGTMFIDD